MASISSTCLLVLLSSLLVLAQDADADDSAAEAIAEHGTALAAQTDARARSAQDPAPAPPFQEPSPAQNANGVSARELPDASDPLNALAGSGASIAEAKPVYRRSVPKSPVQPSESLQAVVAPFELFQTQRRNQLDDDIPKHILQALQHKLSSAYQQRHQRSRYAPMFVGKRDGISDPVSVDEKSYQEPVFVGKKSYRPYFVGKKTSAQAFLGKVPMFIGKKTYLPLLIENQDRVPLFIGKKSYLPTFVGKKNYLPTFVGKKSYLPTFVGKKSYLPTFVGKKSYIPTFVGKKSYLPTFVGKRSYLPTFVGKRNYLPTFVGKKSYLPTFVGKRESETPEDDMLQSPSDMADSAAQDPFPYEDSDAEFQPYGGGAPTRVKRSTDAFAGSDRSLDDADDVSDKRGYENEAPFFVGKRKMPWKVETANLEKRDGYRTPVFVGKREEEKLEQLITALHAYEAARQYRRLMQAEKRYNAPYFVGKKSEMSKSPSFSNLDMADTYFR